MSYRFAIASTEADRDAVHALNYQIFVEEIPQHPPNPEHRLIDRFHAENTYLLCWSGSELVGMVCARANRPFSLDAKLTDLDALLPAHQRLVEIRLLAVKPRHRTPQVFRGLTNLLGRHCAAKGYDLAIVSAYLGQGALYNHIGFRPMGPVVGTPPAQFQPMYLTAEAFRRFAAATAKASAPSVDMCYDPQRGVGAANQGEPS